MREFAVIPGKLSRFDQYARDRSTVPADKLGRRMHYYIHSMLKWSAQVGSCKGIIDNQGHISFVCYISNGTDIQHITAWIAYRLTIQGTCARGQSVSIVLWISAIYKDGIDTPGAQCQVELRVCAAIQAARRDNFVTGSQQGHHGYHLRSHARSCCQCASSPLESRNAFLKCSICGIHDACVNIAKAL